MSEEAERPGHTRPAGEGLADQELAREVADQTSSDLQVEDTFRRESAGLVSDAPAEELSGDELAD